MSILVTGGAGFIGSNFIIEWVKQNTETVINLDKLTYAGNLENLDSLRNNENYKFVHGDIADKALIKNILKTYKPRSVINFAAESHVDRSIDEPEVFINTNIIGTFNLLESSLNFIETLNEKSRDNFRFLHVSTDEVYGSLEKGDPSFNEATPYAPNSPYSASKASADHLVRSYYHTYDLPVLTTNCSNNYGPYQFPEKLIPLTIYNATQGKAIPIYGDGSQIRDWLYVSDHCRAIGLVLEKGMPGNVYNIGGNYEKTNLTIVETICEALDHKKPRQDGKSYKSQIQFVQDRAGHDKRYSIDAKKITKQLGWEPKETFDTGIEKTINWYLDNNDWVASITSGSYLDWVERQYQ